MKKMDTHIRLFGIITILTCLLLMSSGCTEQNKPPTEDTIQTILEKAAILESVSYEIDTSFIIDGVERQNTTIKVWQKNPYLKEEENSTSGNISTTRNIVQRPEGLYLYDPTLQAYQLNPMVTMPQPSTQEMVTRSFEQPDAHHHRDRKHQWETNDHHSVLPKPRVKFHDHKTMDLE